MSATLPAFLTACLSENPHSVDIQELTRRFEYLPIFIYGTEKRGYSNHNQLSHMPRWGYGFTKLAGFNLYSISEGGALAMEVWKSESARIWGEVYLITPDVLFSLDDFHENLVFTHRVERRIQYIEEDNKDKPLKEKGWKETLCWIYLADKLIWNDRRQDLRLSALITPKNTELQPYYCLRPEEDAHYKPKTER